MPASPLLGERSRAELARLVCTPHATGVFTVHSAVDGSPLAELPLGTPDDLSEAARRALAAQPSWAAMPAWFRLAPLRRFHRLLEAYREPVADLVRAESGIPRADALERADRLAAECRAVASSGVRALRPVKLRDRTGGALLTRLEPFGLVAVIPGAAAGFEPAPVLAALLAGNAVLLVPEGPCSVGALLTAQFCAAARLPRDLVQVVPGADGLADAVLPLADHLRLGTAGERYERMWELAVAHGADVTVGTTHAVTDFTRSHTVAR